MQLFILHYWDKKRKQKKQNKTIGFAFVFC